MKLSIVTTLYNSSNYILEFYRRLMAEVDLLAINEYELVFVNDGSPDNSLSVALGLVEMDTNVKVLDLSRNFGHHRAMMCGIRHTTGNRVFLIDVDLEERPEVLSQFWNAMDDDPTIDVVVGELAEKGTPLLRRAASEAFYKVFNALSSVRISNRELVSRLMNRSYVEALVAYQEREIFFPAIWVDAGFKQRKILATKSHDGSSSYTFKKRLAMAVEAVTSFSSKPLIYIFYLGLMFSIGSALFILSILYRKLFIGQVIIGWTSIMAVMFFIGGIIIFSLGVVGIYISKIYLEVKARPNTIVRRVHQKHMNSESN